MWIENTLPIHWLTQPKEGQQFKPFSWDFGGEGEPIVLTVTASVAGAAHGIPIAALLPPAAVEAPGGSVVRAVAVAPHAALLVTAARIHLAKTTRLTLMSFLPNASILQSGCFCISHTWGFSWPHRVSVELPWTVTEDQQGGFLLATTQQTLLPRLTAITAVPIIAPPCTTVAPGHKWNLEELMSRIKPLLCSGWTEPQPEPNPAWTLRHTRL